MRSSNHWFPPRDASNESPVRGKTGSADFEHVLPLRGRKPSFTPIVPSRQVILVTRVVSSRRRRRRHSTSGQSEQLRIAERAPIHKHVSTDSAGLEDCRPRYVLDAPDGLMPIGARQQFGRTASAPEHRQLLLIDRDIGARSEKSGPAELEAGRHGSSRLPEGWQPANNPTGCRPSASYRLFPTVFRFTWA